MTTITKKFWLIILIFPLILLEGLNPSNANANTSINQIKPTSYKDLLNLFVKMDYHWDTLELGVPNIKLHSFPADIEKISNVQEKKHLFFMSLLPMIISQNNSILQQRQQLQQILKDHDQHQKLTQWQQRWLHDLAKQYRCKITPENLDNKRNEILRRVDIVPAALVIAQAANESGYGTSRFAQQANNIFGEWTFKPGTGLIPKQRSAGKTHEIRVFNHLSESIYSYLNNINTHGAYEKLRQYREQMRNNNQPLDAQKLAEGLMNYSTRRDAYVSEIKKMINYNRLSDLSEINLRSSYAKVAEQEATVPKAMLPMSILSSRINAKQLI
ncbi:MAG: hypothetical protein B6I36_02875 [Desulfobacteraceae bacterium 4572_35.1]|nr:MAG: hypothetical protein B6I36_02875 [Desulfobacteraceae bacterium 4572_35.1]